MVNEKTLDIIVVGGGIFGAATVLSLQNRGQKVGLLDPGPIPHPLAASTDISKVVRIEYAADAQYAIWAEEAHQGWLDWNDWLTSEPIYHDVGMLMITSASMAPGEYEYESYQSLRARNYNPDRLDREDLIRRFPAFNANLFRDGYYHGAAGYVESGRVVKALIDRAIDAGVQIFPGNKVKELVIENGHVRGVRTADREEFWADIVIVAAGAWTPYLVPELKPFMKSVGMPVFHLKPSNPEMFEAERFPVFSGDVQRTGWYGFPLHPTEQVVKIANHGVGIPLHPDKNKREVMEHEVDALRAWLAEAIPTLAEAPIVYTRRCLYCDTLDENFWIDRHPDIEGLVIAAGGSGHAFKFGPLLGDWVADVLEGAAAPELEKFGWRKLSPDTKGAEASRYRDEL